MSILAQSIVDRLEATLDAEGNDYYTFAQDFKPAINNGVEWLISVINFAYGAKKIGEEIFRELSFTRVFQASFFNRINFVKADLGHDVWTILAVMPKPAVNPSVLTPNTLADLEDSEYDNRVSHVSSDFSADRASVEEWAQGKNNPFKKGNVIMENCADLKNYAYLNFSNYTSSFYTLSVPEEIEVRPSVANEFVTVIYAKVPTPITLIGDSIEFPEMLTNLLYEKALQYVARKQGDNTTITTVTDKDISVLLKSIL